MHTPISGNGAPEIAPVTILVDKPVAEKAHSRSVVEVWCRKDPNQPDSLDFVCTLVYHRDEWTFGRIGTSYPPSVPLMLDLLKHVRRKYPTGK